MIVTLVVLAIVVILLLAAVLDYRKEKAVLLERLEGYSIANHQKQLELEELRAELAVKKMDHGTAEELLKTAAKRVRLRKSPSELVAEQESAHRTKEERHLTVESNIKAYGLKDLAMRQKEK